MILEVYRDCLPYSIKEKATLIKLGIITILSFLIIPVVFLFGYSYRIIEIGLGGALIENEDPLGNFKDLKQLFIQGLKIIAVTILYSLPAFIISILAIFNFDLISFTHFLSNFKINFQIDFGITFTLLFLIIWFITFIFISTAIPHMVNRGKIKYAFRIDELITIIKHVTIFEYLKFYLSFIILAIAFIIIGFLATDTIMNILNIIALNLYNFTFKGPAALYLALSLLAIIFSFILIPIFIITESRVTSFIYNEDALLVDEEEDLDTMKFQDMY